MPVTADAHTLSPSPGLLGQMVSDHGRLGLSGLIRSHAHARTEPRVGAARGLSTLVSRSRRTGPAAFRARLNGSTYVLDVRPTTGNRFAVVGVRRLGSAARRGDDGVDGEVSRGFSLRLVWAPRRTLASFLNSPASGGGIYIVEKNDGPRYVGLATRFSSRYRVYGHALNAFDVSTRPYHVRAAGMTGTGSLRDAEHAVIRAIEKHFRKRVLTNRSSVNAFRATAGGVSLVNAGSRPPYLPATVSVSAGSEYETYGDAAPGATW